MPTERFRVVRDGGLAWFRASDTARRGFCKDCGATLFWKADAEDRMSFSPGALDGATGLAMGEHIFTDDAGDYYAPEGPALAVTVSGAGAAAAPLSAECQCGQVRFALPGPAGALTACHCSQCRRLSGHYAASFDADETAVQWHDRQGLAEYETPNGGKRGFCTGCGSSLYFRAPDGGFSVEAGAVGGATGGLLSAHIFVADKGDYYPLCDGLPQDPEETA